MSPLLQQTVIPGSESGRRVRVDGCPAPADHSFRWRRGSQGAARPDHSPRMTYADFEDEHETERLFAIGYMKGLIEAVYSELD